MKIGIVTWFTYENYGSKLQALALKKVLEGYSNEVYEVNYNPDSLKYSKSKLREKSRIKRIQEKIHNLLVDRAYSKAINIKHQKMEKFISDNFQLTDFISTENDYITIANQMDLLVFGSDQIWFPGLFHNFYYGNYKEINVPKVSYAPSIGVEIIDDPALVSLYQSSLKDFKEISVREDAGKRVLEGIISRSVTRVVDPTLLLGRQEWNNILGITERSEDYIFVYLLGENVNHYKAIRKFADKNHLKIIIVPTTFKSFFFGDKIVAEAGPSDFVELLSNATYVITDSFHGLMFSLIYKKNFYLFTRFSSKDPNSQNSRIYQVINELGLQTRLFPYGTKEISHTEKIDYDTVNEKLSILRGQSIHFIENNILKRKI